MRVKVKSDITYEAMRIDYPADIKPKELCEFMGGEEKRNLDFGINYKTGKVFVSNQHGYTVIDPSGYVVKDSLGVLSGYTAEDFHKRFDFEKVA